MIFAKSDPYIANNIGWVNHFKCYILRWDGLVVSVSNYHAVDRGFAPKSGHTNDHKENGTNCLPAWHAGVRVEVW